ncbi:hypothetical protein K1719_044350 [Acacia pycnantha]|nr:hypothetical protein K1719_044350 [Acacia pycnantha]
MIPSYETGDDTITPIYNQEPETQQMYKADSSLVDGCYHRAVQLLGDMEDCVRSSAIRVVASWGLILAASNADMKSYWLKLYRPWKG